MKKTILISMLLLVVTLVVFYDKVSAFDSGTLLADSAVNDATVGTIDWANPTNALTDDGSTNTTCGCRISGGVTDDTIKLFVGGVPVGNDKGLGTTMSTGIRTYGGANDLWGITPTATQINSTDFGIGISFVGNGGTSKYLYISDFDFAIPTNSSVIGITVSMDIINAAGNPSVDYVSIKVYYADSSKVVINAPVIIKGQVII